MASYKLNIVTVNAVTDLPVPNIQVDLYDNSNQYGWLGGGITDAYGNLAIFLPGVVSDLFTGGLITIRAIGNRGAYQVAYANLTYAGLYSYYYLPLDGYYDSYLPDETRAYFPDNNYCVVSGRLTAVSGRRLPGVRIQSYEEGFRQENIIAQTDTDSNGNYLLKVPRKGISVMPTLDRRTLRVKAVDAYGNTLTISERIVDFPPETEVNLIIPEDMPLPPVTDEFQAKLSQLDQITSSYPPAYINNAGPGTETPYLSIATGQDAGSVNTLVDAHKYSDIAWGWVPGKFFYALLNAGVSTQQDALMNLSEEAITQIFTDAGDKGIINTTSWEIEMIVSNLKYIQAENTGAIFMEREQVYLSDFFSFFVPYPGMPYDFLYLYQNYTGDNLTGFWDQVTFDLGDFGHQCWLITQLMGLTGYQPMLTQYLTWDIYYGSSIPNIQTLATWVEADWYTYLSWNDIIAPNSMYDPADPYGSMWNYALRLKEVFQDMYPATTIRGRLDGIEGTVLIPDTGRRSNVITFLNNNPLYDPRLHNAHEINNGNFDVSGVTNITAVKEELTSFQVLTRIAGAKLDAVFMLQIEGIKSAHDLLASYTAEDFAASYSPLMGGTGYALRAYIFARQIANISALTLSNIRLDLAAPIFSLSQSSTPADPELATLFGSMDQCACAECTSVYSPGAYYVDTLHFLQLKSKTRPFSPYSELMRRRPDLEHIDITCKNANTPLPYIDLVNELLELELLRKIVQSPPFYVPPSYQTTGAAGDLAAYPQHVYKQVTGSVTEYKDYFGYEVVYDTMLRNAVYPWRLPFNLALEEGRTYLQQLGYSRMELMRVYRPYDKSALLPDEITDDNYYTETLGISRESAVIIADDSHYQVYNYYGISASVNDFISPSDSSVRLTGPWYQLLLGAIPDTPSQKQGGIDVLVSLLKISYHELLQLLVTDFLNPEISGARQVHIVSRDDEPADTCILSKLKLDVNISPELLPGFCELFFGKMHRFVRLWRAIGLNIYETDILLRSFSATDISNVPGSGGNDYLYRHLAQAVFLSRQTNLDIERFVTWWSPVNDLHYINFYSDRQDSLPTLYDQLFRNKSVVNPPDEAFKDIASLGSSSYGDHIAAIAAAAGIGQDETILLIEDLGISQSTGMSLQRLTDICTVAWIAKSLQFSIRDFIRFRKLNAFAYYPVPAVPTLANAIQQLERLEALQRQTQALRTSGFSLDDLEYLLMDKDAVNRYIPQTAAIQPFYEKLRQSLAIVYEDTTGITDPTVVEAIKNRMRNVILQQTAAQFSAETQSVRYLTSTLLTFVVPDPANPGQYIDQPVLDALLDMHFIHGLYPLSPEGIAHAKTDPDVTLPDFDLDELYPLYCRLAKIAFLIRITGVKPGELEQFQLAYAQLGLPDLKALPIVEIPSVGATAFAEVMRYLDWIRLRKHFDADQDDFILLLRQSAMQPVTGVTISKEKWIEVAAQVAQWNNTFIKTLVGPDMFSGGLLHTRYDILQTDFRYPDLLIRITVAASVSDNTGLDPMRFIPVLYSSVLLEDTRRIRNAVKARYDDASWQKIAKPLQDVLREKQRQALVDYLLAHPEPSGSNKKIWRNERDLYAHLLIDVEMQPCMMTTRIRQAISSVQLYMDRVIFNLEYENYDRTRRITLTPDSIAEWKEWRKWYRVWEANRKIFLYPENWIEPDLRDDKTPFFMELESQLMQEEMTAEKVEDATLEYLRKLEEVARLEPVGVYQDKNTNITHVISRTYSSPHIYYYRRLVAGEWTAWESMGLEISGDHVAPVVWNDRLYLFWLTFTEKSLREEDMNDIKKKQENYVGPYPYWVKTMAVDQHAVTDEAKARSAYWDIYLNWSEYKDGRWLSSQVSQDKMTLEPHKIQYANDSTKSYSRTQNELNILLAELTQRRDLSLAEVFRDRLRLHPVPADNGPLVLSLLFCSGLHEQFISLHAFMFEDRTQNPYVLRNNFFGYHTIAPKNTQMRRMKHREVQLASADSPLVAETFTFAPSEGFFIYIDNGVKPGTGYRMLTRNTGSQPILKQTPNGPFTITTSANAYKENEDQAPLQDNFFFEDNKHLFFVRRNQLAVENTGIVAASRNMVNASFLQADKAYQFYYWTSGNKVYTNTNVTVHMATFSLAPPITITLNPSYTLQFQAFYHAHVKDFMQALGRGGLDGLLRLTVQDNVDRMKFNEQYQPTGLVHELRPTDIVDFSFGSAYSVYNWELFFHIPMLIAQQLSSNQQFEDAQKWFHYIFDPTSNVNDKDAPDTSKQRFWRFRPFYEEAGKTIVTVTDMMQHIDKYMEQVAKWEDNPFKPHVIARMRLQAYMKNTVMKYLDNLIAWADQLFRRDTMESINEATQLYILAANILGERPREIPPRTVTAAYTYYQLITESNLDPFSNALVKIESYIDPNAGPLTKPISIQLAISSSVVSSPPLGWFNIDQMRSIFQLSTPLKMQYFCLPNNAELLKYWDIIADRLFKIRHCMNIEGVVRQLPIYDPPIDPALLVRAAAAGIGADEVLNNIAGIGIPCYRFGYMLQKANELCADVKSLGASLLAALEKKDAEELALLRSGHERRLLEAVKGVKEAQIREAEETLEALRKTRAVTQFRYDFYSTREIINDGEWQSFGSSMKAALLHMQQGRTQALAAALSAIPQFHGQMFAAVGTSAGGQQITAGFQAKAAALSANAAVESIQGGMMATMAGYLRRYEDWILQTGSAQRELEQIDRQILAAEIRLDIAKRELANQELQIENSKEVDAYMRAKYTNKELYNWMKTQLASVYFQTYQLAFDLAKKAELCFDKELPQAKSKKPAAGFIKFGYWDSLRSGLLSGEQLQYDLRKMDASYAEWNERQLELTKHISLAAFDPHALVQLQQSGITSFSIPEMLYDLDHPGHYLRRIKAVSITIPGVTGPYTNISAKLSLTNNRIRISDNPAGGYAYTGPSDIRFEKGVAARTSIATSTGQNDSGMFELNFRDERYLPFEGAGAVSEWTLEFPNTFTYAHQIPPATIEEFRQFNYETISDIIVTIYYTALDSGSPDLRRAAQENIETHINELLNEFASGPEGLWQTVSLKRQFPKELNMMLNKVVAGIHSAELQIEEKHFPYIFHDKEIETQDAVLILIPKTGTVNWNTNHNAIVLQYKQGTWNAFGDSQTATNTDPKWAYSATILAKRNSIGVPARGEWKLVVDESTLGGVTIDGTLLYDSASHVFHGELIEDIILAILYRKG